jgi:hypothetical protein
LLTSALGWTLTSSSPEPALRFTVVTVPTGRSGGERLTLSPLVETMSPVCTVLSTPIWLRVSSLSAPWPLTQPRSSSPSDVVVVGTVVVGAVSGVDAGGPGATDVAGSAAGGAAGGAVVGAVDATCCGPGSTLMAIEKFGSVINRTVARSPYTFMIRPTRPAPFTTGMPTRRPRFDPWFTSMVRSKLEPGSLTTWAMTCGMLLGVGRCTRLRRSSYSLTWAWLAMATPSWASIWSWRWSRSRFTSS